MKRNKIHRNLILLILFLQSFITCQQTTDYTVNLQYDERYLLKLTDYYNFTASQVDFPKDLPAENTQKPYQEIGKELIGPIISSLTYYQENLNSKYFIGYNKELKGDQCFDVQIIYFHLEIIQGVMTRTLLSSNTLFQTCNNKFLISASFYNSSEGFISYQSEKDSLTFHFSYAQEKGLTILKLNDTLKIVDQVALQKSGNIYILYVESETVGLIQYKFGENNLQIVDTYKIKEFVSKNIFVDPANTLFYFDNSKSILHSFFIDYKNNKLIINQLTLPQLISQYFAQGIQRFKDALIITFTKKGRGNIFIQLKMQQLIEENVFYIDDIIQTALQIEYYPIFIEYNTLVMYNKQSFQMVNVKNQQILFQQTLDQNHIVDPKQFIDNQFIVNKSKKDDKGTVITINYTVKLQIPSIVIIGTNTKLEFKIYQIDPSYSLILKIIINVTNDLKASLTQNQISIQNMITSLTDEVYQIPIERYIKGSNFNPQISVSENNFIKNLKVNRIIQLKYSTLVQINHIQNIYQTDGIISSIITSKSGNTYSIFAAAPQIYGKSSEINLYSSLYQHSSPIEIIDNSGSFILKSDVGTQSFTIFIPFINKQRALIYAFFSQNCRNRNFAFASDTQNNILFIMCGQSIEQFNYDYPGDSRQLVVTSQKKLIFDASNYSNLICLQGKIFIYNDLSIAAYDYFGNSFIGNPIQIPQLYPNQKIILFSESFIIYTNSQQKLNILLYSYSQFQNDQAVFLRNLIQDQPLQSNLSIIPKRNKIEYLYVSNSVQYQYSLFRINNAYSQNQFYSTVSIVSDNQNVPVISQDLICIIGSNKQEQCQQILQQATISYQLNVKQSDFNRLLTFFSQITLQFEDQQQVYNLSINRDASLKYVTFDKNAEGITKFKSEIENSNLDKETIFYFNDKKVSNGCNLGWYTQVKDVKIINRLKNIDSQNDYQVFTVLYNLKAVLESKQIIIGNNLLKIQRDSSHKRCNTILDDSASRVQVNEISFNQNIYVLCMERLYNYTIQFTSDKTGNIVKASLVDQSSTPMDFNVQFYLCRFKQIISNEAGLWLYFPTKNLKYQIVKKDDSDELAVLPQDQSLTSELSYNRINSLNLALSFFRSGLINVKNVQNKDIQYQYYIQDLLERENLIVGESVQISLVAQYSDTKFRIQFVDSFIYDITFSMDKNNQFKIQNASLYYHKDAFSTLDAGISSNQYTLLFGQINYSRLTVALYDNQSSIQFQYLISSKSEIDQKFLLEDGLSVTHAEQISQNQFVIYFNNGGSTVIEISESIQLILQNNKEFFQNRRIIIYPKDIMRDSYDKGIIIYVSSNRSSPPSPSTVSSLIKIINPLNVLFLLCLLLV